jgi:hypothetical protein
MTRPRISLTVQHGLAVLVEQKVPRPPSSDQSLADRGANSVELVEISSAFPAGSAEDLAVWL